MQRFIVIQKNIQGLSKNQKCKMKILTETVALLGENGTPYHTLADPGSNGHGPMIF